APGRGRGQRHPHGVRRDRPWRRAGDQLFRRPEVRGGVRETRHRPEPEVRADADGGQRGDRFDRGRGRAGARGAGQAAGRDPGAGGRAAGRVSMRWDVVAWAAVALLLFAAEALAPGAFMLWMGFAAAALFVTVLFVPGIP